MRVGVATLGLLGCLSSALAEEPSAQQKMAAVRDANRALGECGRQQVAGLDDGISPANLIAKVIASRCLNEVAVAVATRALVVDSKSTKESLTQELGGDSIILLDVVLTYRAARR